MLDWINEGMDFMELFYDTSKKNIFTTDLARADLPNS